MNQQVDKIYLKLQEWTPWFTAALAVLSSNWAATAISGTINLWASGETGSISLLQIVYCFIFIGAICLLYRQRNAFFRPHTRRLSNERPEQRPHLVMFLSNLPKKLEESDGLPTKLTTKLNLSCNSIDKIIQALEELKQADPPLRWPWEMPLRAIRHHLPILKTVTLMCSNESLPQAHLFINICQKCDEMARVKFHLLVRQKEQAQLLTSSDVNLICSHEGWDFESFDELSRALSILLKEFKKRKYLDQEIMIDFTGGQKVTSVVAVAMTLNRQIKAQYVQTNPPWGILSYDVILTSSETGGLGI